MPGAARPWQSTGLHTPPRGESVKSLLCATLPFLLCSPFARASVTVKSPTNGEKVTSPVPYAAKSSTSTCSKGVAAMGVYVDEELVYKVNDSKLDAKLSIKPGEHQTVIREWDHCGGASQTSRTLTVATPTAIAVASPASKSTTTSPVTYKATATSSCTAGVASMGVSADGQPLVTQNGSSLDASVELAAGVQNTTVEEWDKCGGNYSVPVSVTVEGSPAKLSNLQRSAGWESWGQLPPRYVDCSPCSGLAWSMSQGISSPSLSGNAAKFETRGTKPWAVVLWINPVIGSYSTQGLPDKDKTLVPSLHNFTYDTDFFITDASVTHALEFDVAMYTGGVGMFWGTQCVQGAGSQWDVLDKGGKGWVSVGIPCNFVNGWNHLTLQFQRVAGNNLLYKSVTLNGVTDDIYVTYLPQAVSKSWYGVTVNYQMDGDKWQDANTTYLDNLSLTYW